MVLNAHLLSDQWLPLSCFHFYRLRTLTLVPQKILRHHRRPLRPQHHLLHLPDRRHLGNRPLGLGSRLPDLPLHRRFPGGDMRRLPHCRRCLLLECNAVDQEVCAHHELGHRVVDAGGELDGHDEYQFWRSAVDSL